jgi:arginase
LGVAAFALVEVPAMAGDPQHPAAAGPATITGALRDAGYGLPARRVSVGSPTGDTIADSIRLNTAVRNVVRAIAAHGGTPLVLAGSCDVAPGIVAGLGRPDVGVIWLDAHADFNTPESSISGFWPGMTLAVVVGDCGHNVWSALGGRPVAPEHVLLLGVRSLSPEEESRRLQQSAIQVVPWRDGVPQKHVPTALEALSEEIEDVYLHFDLDALDPTVAKGIVDPPEPGGLSRSQLAELIAAIRARLNVVGATIATYTPTNDDGLTLQVAIDAVRQLLGQRT